MTPPTFVAAFNSPDAPCPVCGVALGSSMMHEPPECIAVLRRHLSESEARARVAEGAYQQMRGEAIAVTPEIRAAVDLVDYADRAIGGDRAAGSRAASRASYDDEHTIEDERACNRARLALADLILAAVPPVKP